MICRLQGVAAGFLIAGAVVLGVATAQEHADTIVKTGVVDSDLYLVGRTIEIAAKATGDIVAAGRHVSVGQQVAGDVIVAGETVNVRGEVGDDVRAAGRHVVISARVADHVVAAGERVTLAADAATGSWAWLAGRVVQVLGEVGGELKAAGQEVVIGGTVHGDVSLTAGKIRILDTAHILGRLQYRSAKEPDIADGAQIDGGFERLALPDFRSDTEEAVGAVLVAVVVLVTGVLVVGAVYLLAFPAFSVEAASIAVRRPWAALGLGFAVFVSVPLMTMFAMMTIVGLLPALVVLALYLVTLLLGYVSGVAWVVELALRWRGKATTRRRVSLLTFALVLCVLTLLQLLPMVGQLVGLVVWMMGIGSLLMAFAARYRTSPATPRT